MGKLALDAAEVLVPAADGKLRLHAWLYVPEDRPAAGAPILVMAHGFGAQKDFGLNRSAQHFAAGGIAVLLFDYRHWGLSEGEPNHLLNVAKQHQDYFAVLDFCFDGLGAALEAHGLDKRAVNPDRLAIFGSSFSGGHVIAVAATYKRKERIKAVVSQVPFSGGEHSVPALIKHCGILWLLRVAAHALYDGLRGLLGLERHYIPILSSRDGSPLPAVPILCTAECVKYWDIIPNKPIGGWKNRLPAWIGLTMALYRPHTLAHKVTAPVLGLYSPTDSLCPVRGVLSMFSKVRGPVQLEELAGGHFGAYVQDFDKAMALELGFLRKHLA